MIEIRHNGHCSILVDVATVKRQDQWDLMFKGYEVIFRSRFRVFRCKELRDFLIEPFQLYI